MQAHECTSMYTYKMFALVRSRMGRPSYPTPGYQLFLHYILAVRVTRTYGYCFCGTSGMSTMRVPVHRTRVNGHEAAHRCFQHHGQETGWNKLRSVSVHTYIPADQRLLVHHTLSGNVTTSIQSCSYHNSPYIFRQSGIYQVPGTYETSTIDDTRSAKFEQNRLKRGREQTLLLRKIDEH